MFSYIIRRLLFVIPVAFGIVSIVSVVIHLAPGDPVEQIAGPYATDLEKAEIREKMGLDQALWVQVKSYITQVFKGDLGQSLILNRPVGELIAERVLPTVELAFFSLLVALGISLPLGILSALRSRSWVDFSSMTFAVLGVAMPNFWLGPMLILLFSIHLGWLPVSERMGWDSYILPCITLGTALAAVLTRMTRASVLENMREDYIRTARAKGLAESTVVLKHVLRNSALPVVTILGLQFGVLLTGSVITEKIFDWPGLGTLMISAINNRDYPVVQGCVLIFSSSYVLMNLATDLAYAWLDPRIRVGES